VNTLTNTVEGRKKAAILCVSLGVDAAAQVLRHVPPDMLEPLVVEMARTTDVDQQMVNDVLGELVEMSYARGYLAEGGATFAREALERAVGPGRAGDIFSRLSAAIEATPLDFLRRSHPDQIWAFLRNENPQTIAVVLANVPAPELAANVMKLIPPELQADLARRIATMEQVSPEILKEIARMLKGKLDAVVTHDYTTSGGVHSLASILNAADRGVERNVLESLESKNPDLANEVRALMFVFEDILKLDDRSIQLVLKDIDTKDLALALRGSSDDVTERIMANMSQRGGELLREEMEFMQPQRRRVIEEAQTKIVASVRRLEEAGEIMIARGAADEDVVV
jgi:flagellar motor switch protein FliG